jgi:colicin import membrane protein
MNPEPKPLSPAVPPADNPYYYGWRYVERRLPDGRVEVDQVGLTLEDVLHPQEDDVIPERPLHELERGYLAGVFRTRLEGLNHGLVLSDCLVDWGIEGLRDLSPDVSVFEDVRTPPDLTKGTFHLAESGGGRCVLVVELVSPHTRTNDVDRKPEEYHRAGVPLYVLVDQEREGGPRQIRAYEHRPEGYVEVPLDSRGRLFLGPFGLCLGLKEGRVVCYDTVSGRELGDYAQVSRDLDAAEEKARREAAARQQAEQQARQEAAARQQAEQQARQEAAARQQAEQQARQEAAARQQAEMARQQAQEQARQEAVARQQAEMARTQAEERARQEAQIRTQMEARLRELEDQLRRMGE